MAATWKKIVFSGSAPQFTTIELGHASDTTISRTGSGDIAVEGNAIYRAGGTDIPVTDGGTGRSTGTTAYALVATGTTATGAQQTLANGATTEVLVGGGASALPVWTTATGSGAPVRQTSPSLTGTLGFAPATELTIAAGAVTAAQVLHLIDTESDAASDDLVTINGGVDGLQLEIRAAHTDRTVVIKETGNILTGGSDIRLDDTNKYILFTYDGALSKWVVVGGSGSGGSGASKEITQATHGFAIGDLLYLNGAVYTKAIASASATAEVVGIVSIVGGTDEFTLSTGGWVEGLSGLTAGTVYFLSGDTAGAMTATEPVTEGYISKPCFIADSTTSGYFFNMRGAVVGAGAVTYATAGEITTGTEPAKAIAPDQLKLSSPTFANITDSGLTASQMVCTDADKKLVSKPFTFTRGGTLVNTVDYVAAMNVGVWYATCACTVTNVRGYRVGGDSSVAINARRNGSATKHLNTDKTLANADTWYDGGNVQDITYAVGDKLEIMVTVASGNPTQVAIQVDFVKI
ncbi:MAG: hypothetical protein M0R00_01490 [Candidatus Omnitrophica bacterium]|jgi:hypothetical protein|nr:hypothetical protein [Candidatus Omnitrophota bacterium]